EPRSRIDDIRASFERAVALVPKENAAPRVDLPTADEVDGAVLAMVRARFVPASQKFEQVLGRESSSKAVHAGETEARERRKALRARQLRIEIFNQRQRGFMEMLPRLEDKGLDAAHAEAHRVLGAFLERVSASFDAAPAAREGIRREMNALVGRFLACASRG